jgi:hypothetical protein
MEREERGRGAKKGEKFLAGENRRKGQTTSNPKR